MNSMHTVVACLSPHPSSPTVANRHARRGRGGGGRRLPFARRIFSWMCGDARAD